MAGRFKKPFKPSSTKRGSSSATKLQSGSKDPVLDWMQKNQIPVTRQSYLNLAYMGKPPEGLSVEEEANLPREVRRSQLRNKSKG